MTESVVAGSFRDPAGFVFRRDGELFRQVNAVYREHYDALMQSGLYESLVRDGLLVAHEEAGIAHALTPGACNVLRPERIPFISYPYEWCFSQLRDAALLTLEVQKRAFAHGLTLKDATAYNIQFLRGRPVFIDTLSFETYRPGQIWVPYRQFCQHFLAPLALAAYRDPRHIRALRVHLDGMPLDLAAPLLPRRTLAVPGLLMHVHLHARAQRRYAGRPQKAAQRSMGKTAFQGLVDSLASAVRALQWKPEGTEWADYYGATNYSSSAFEDKRTIVREFLEKSGPAIVWDLGANTGLFSRVAAATGAQVISFDVDAACVERNYRECSELGEARVLPLCLDLTNPSPDLGWAIAERDSFVGRGSADLILALALVHHLAIANNVPLPSIAATFARMGRDLVIEFVDKSDSQVQRLLASREDVFPDYTREGFEAAFAEHYEILETRQPGEASRLLYRMRGRTVPNH